MTKINERIGFGKIGAGVEAGIGQGALSNEELGQVLRSFPEPMFIYDAEGRYLDIFGGVDGEYYHYAKHLIGKRMRDIMPKAKAHEFEALISQSLREQRTIRHLYTLCAEDIGGKDGDFGPSGQIYFEAHISPIIDSVSDQPKVLWLAFNVTEFMEKFDEMEAEAKGLKAEARLDPLTQILNRRGFAERASGLFERRKHDFGYLCMADLDHFKKLNDAFGHQAGDEVLAQCARRLSDLLRKQDVIARYGGEEFIVWINTACVTFAVSIAERLRDAICSSPFQYNDHPIDVALSVGITRVLATDLEIGDALRRADKALYRAKAEGRNRVLIG